MLEAMQIKDRGARCEPELAMDMVEACVKAGMDEEAAALLAAARAEFPGPSWTVLRILHLDEAEGVFPDGRFVAVERERPAWQWISRRLGVSRSIAASVSSSSSTKAPSGSR